MKCSDVSCFVRARPLIVDSVVEWLARGVTAYNERGREAKTVVLAPDANVCAPCLSELGRELHRRGVFVDVEIEQGGVEYERAMSIAELSEPEPS